MDISKEQIDWVIEQMALIEDVNAALTLFEIQESTSEFDADDLSLLMDDELGRAAYLRSFKEKIHP